MLYRERMWPTAWVWVLGLGLTGSVGIAYGAAYGPSIGLVTFVLLASIAVAALVISAPVVSVTAQHLRAGRATIPCNVLTRCAPLDAEGMRRALRLADPSLYMLVRPWSVRQGVIVEVDDPVDPHTSWLLSSRQPEDLVRALEKAGVDGRTRDADRS
jgi:hypothetical protein